VQPSMLYVCVSVSHVLVGALLLASSIILTLSCFRLIRPSAMESVAKAGTSQSHRDGSPERARISSESSRVWSPLQPLGVDCQVFRHSPAGVANLLRAEPPAIL
jgi:hypothetical protein